MPITKRPLLDLQTGVEYKSVAEAAKALNLTSQMVCNLAKPQRFEYIDEALMKPTDTTIKSIKVTIPHYSNRANMMMGEIDKFINNLAINTYDDIPLTIEYDMDDGTAFCSSFNLIK